MGPPYSQNKKYIYKYALAHPDKIKQIEKKRSIKRCTWLKIQREFLGISKRFFPEE